jgi:tetratricopeptide (TPR) repeat protein
VQFDVEGGDAVIKEISSASITQPSLDRAISFEGSFIPKESQGAVRAKIEAAIALLKKDSSNLSHWIELGFYRHQAGDYRGEEEVWLYLNTVAENDIISTMNLGNLYMNFLKDYAKAEMYYRAALRIDSKNLDAYQNLYMLYKYLYKTNTSAAADVEKEALKAVPSESNYISTWAAL